MRIQTQTETFGYRMGTKYLGPDSLDWQHGVPQPLTRKAYENWPGRDQDVPVDYSDHSTALANLGETQYAIGAWPKLHGPDLSGNTHNWGIDRRIGPDANNPDHWGSFNEGAGEYEGRSPAGLMLGSAPSKHHAMAEAEQNWNLHKEHMQGSQMPDVAQHGDPFGSRTDTGDEDYGNIFGRRL